MIKAYDANLNALTGKFLFPDVIDHGNIANDKSAFGALIDLEFRTDMEQFAFGSDVPAETKTKIGRLMQDDIDAYKKLLALYDSQKYIEGEGQISAGLVV